MENSLLMTLTALLLLGVQGISAQSSINNISTPSTPRPTSATTSTTLQATCPKRIEYITKSDLFQLKVIWKVGPCEDPLGTELAAYKAVTGILIFLILGVILVQFGRPTYKAIRKRFSQKRQNRWVGPTQSVCYNRGQGPPNKNTDKRQSFPGLERLTVNQSREPSSNRNSDYDSYGYS
ncbi:hypothetical protein cypCar_00010740 [Cyprinus carpio]|nr:hypothetical protein cypCar_00010740 [Cyprinus carpio]